MTFAAFGERASAAPSVDRTYRVTGKDSFSIGAGAIRTEVAYEGKQRLTVRAYGKYTRYVARAAYTKSDGAVTTGTRSDFVADVSPSGEVADSANHDPDYLTVLNQPFAAQLDRATLSDLRRLRGVLPFDFPSPLGGASLHGYLRHASGGVLGLRHAIGVKFEAAGPVRGDLPERPGMVLRGTMTMRGTAFYEPGSALLLTLDTRVTIAGTVSNRAANDPVTIVYGRTIRVEPPSAPDRSGP